MPATQRYKGHLCRIKTLESLTLIGVVFLGTLALPELYIRFLHDRCADSASDCGGVTGLFLSNENTIGPAIDLLALVLREASRDR